MHVGFAISSHPWWQGPGCQQLTEASALVDLLNDYLSESNALSLPALVERHAAAPLAGLERALMACPRAPAWTPASLDALRALLQLRTTLLKRSQVDVSVVHYTSATPHL